MAPTLILGTLLVGAAGVVNYATPTLPNCAGYMQATDPTAICYDAEQAERDATVRAANEPAAILAASGGRECSPPSAWQQPALRDEVPSWVVGRAASGEVVGLPFDEAWADATAGDLWVLVLCR